MQDFNRVENTPNDVRKLRKLEKDLQNKLNTCTGLISLVPVSMYTLEVMNLLANIMVKVLKEELGSAGVESK